MIMAGGLKCVPILLVYLKVKLLLVHGSLFQALGLWGRAKGELRERGELRKRAGKLFLVLNSSPFFPSFFSPVPSPSLNLKNHLRFVAILRWVCCIKITREFSHKVIYRSLFGKGTRDRTRE